MPKPFSHRLMSQMSQKYNRSIVILWRALLWIFKKWFMKTLKQKNIHFITDISLYIRSQTFWSFLKFYFVHIVKVCFVYYAYIPLYMNKTLLTLGNEKEQQQIKIYKNCWISWFSCGQLKISKCSISLTQLGECSKNKVTPL